MPVWQSGKTRMWSLLKPSLFVVRYSRILATCRYWARLSQQHGEKSPSAYNQSISKQAVPWFNLFEVVCSAACRGSSRNSYCMHQNLKKAALESYLLGYKKMVRCTTDNWWLVTGTLVRLSMKHKVGFGVDDLKSFIVSCLLTLPSLINLYSITRNKKKKKYYWSSDHVLLHHAMHCIYPTSTNTPWTETSKQAGSKSNQDLEQFSVTIIIRIVFYEKRKESTGYDKLDSTHPSLSQPDDADDYTVLHTPMADFFSRNVIHYPVSTGL